jgi:MscS family membrane protein
MQQFLNQVFLDNTIRAYLVCFGVILLVIFIKRNLSKYTAGILYKLVKRASWNIDKKAFVDLLLGPLDFFIVVVITLVALDRLNFPSAFYFEIHHVSSKQIVDSISAGILVLVFTWLMLRMVDFIAGLLEQKAVMNADVADNQMIVFFRDFFKVVLVVVGLLLLIRFSFNKNIGTLLAGLSIVGAAIALAARESLENLIASFIIFFDKPFYVGDLVKVQAVTGTIEKIGLRSTRIRTDQKTYVTVPNKQMVDSILDNLSLRTLRRADLRLEIGLETTATQMEKAIAGIQAILSHPLVQSKTVLFTDISTTAFIVSCEYYTGVININEFNDLKQKVNLEVLSMLNNLGVPLAGAATDVRIVRND